MADLQRKLVALVEPGQESVVRFNGQLIPIQDGAGGAVFEVSFGLDAVGPFLRRAKAPDGKIIFVNKVQQNGAEIRISHAFFSDEEPFRLEGFMRECGYSLHTLNKPSAFIEFVELEDPQDKTKRALGLECCAYIEERKAS